MSAEAIRQIPIVDLMMGIPVSETNEEWYASFLPLLKDRESIEQFKMPVQYMFRDVPVLETTDDYVAFLVGEMDRFGIDIAPGRIFRGLASGRKRQGPVPGALRVRLSGGPQQGYASGPGNPARP